MSIVFLALGTTRARAVCASARFLVEHGVKVDLITVEEKPWRAEGLDERVRVLSLSTRADRLLANKLLAKFYKLVRPYVMWRAARRQALRLVDWNAVEQAVISDSHAIPIGWHLARRHPKLNVAFELDRTPYLATEQQHSEQQRSPAADPASVSAGSDSVPLATGTVAD